MSSSGIDDGVNNDDDDSIKYEYTFHDNGTDGVEELNKETLVECSISTYVDKVENNDNQNTPEEHGRGNVELKLKQVFDSLEEFKEAMVDYVLKQGWNVKYSRWGNEKSELKCAIKGDYNCQWRIYCSFEEPVGKWMIKAYDDKHRCVKNGYSKLLTQTVIAKLFLNEIRNDLKLKPKVIQEQIQKRWNLIASNDQCRKAKSIALEIIQKEQGGVVTSMLQDSNLVVDSSVEFDKGSNEKKVKRKECVNESTPVKKKTKVTREGRIVRCGRCGIVGHNTRKCSNVGVEYIRPKNRKKTLDEGFEFMALDYNEEPNQSA